MPKRRVAISSRQPLITAGCQRPSLGLLYQRLLIASLLQLSAHAPPVGAQSMQQSPHDKRANQAVIRLTRWMRDACRPGEMRQRRGHFATVHQALAAFLDNGQRGHCSRIRRADLAVFKYSAHFLFFIHRPSASRQHGMARPTVIRGRSRRLKCHIARCELQENGAS